MTTLQAVQCFNGSNFRKTMSFEGFFYVLRNIFLKQYFCNHCKKYRRSTGLLWDCRHYMDHVHCQNDSRMYCKLGGKRGKLKNKCNEPHDNCCDVVFMSPHYVSYFKHNPKISSIYEKHFSECKFEETPIEELQTVLKQQNLDKIKVTINDSASKPHKKMVSKSCCCVVSHYCYLVIVCVWGYN